MKIQSPIQVTLSTHLYLLMSYILSYFIADVNNIMQCPSNEWLTASTIFEQPQLAYQSPVQNFY